MRRTLGFRWGVSIICNLGCYDPLYWIHSDAHPSWRPTNKNVKSRNHISSSNSNISKHELQLQHRHKITNSRSSLSGSKVLLMIKSPEASWDAKKSSKGVKPASWSCLASISWHPNSDLTKSPKNDVRTSVTHRIFAELYAYIYAIIVWLHFSCMMSSPCPIARRA